MLCALKRIYNNTILLAELINAYDAINYSDNYWDTFSLANRSVIVPIVLLSLKSHFPFLWAKGVDGSLSPGSLQFGVVSSGSFHFLHG